MPAAHTYCTTRLSQSAELTLALLVARVLAHHENLAVATDDLALIAHLLDRRTYFHCPFLSVRSNTVSHRPAADVVAELC